MRRPVIQVPFLVFVMCLSWSALPSTAQTWQQAFHEERMMRRELLREQHAATVKQLHHQLRAAHPRDIAGKRAILECMLSNNECYHEQLMDVVRDERHLRQAYRSGYRQWQVPGPSAIRTIGPQTVFTPVSPLPTVVASPTYRVVPTDRRVTVPQIVTPPMVTQPPASGSTVVTPGSDRLAPIPDQRPAQRAVVPASNLEPIPQGVESLPTPSRAGEPTPAQRLPK